MLKKSALATSLSVTLLLVVMPALQARAADTWAYQSGWTTSDCYRHIEWRLRVKKPFAGAQQREAYIELRNRYARRVWIDAEFEVNGSGIKGRTHLAPGESSSAGLWTIISNTSSISVQGGVRRARFDRDDWGERYEPCDL